MVVDALASMNGEIYDGIVDLQRQIEESEASCTRLEEDFLAQTKDLEGQQEGAEVKVATTVPSSTRCPRTRPRAARSAWTR